MKYSLTTKLFLGLCIFLMVIGGLITLFAMFRIVLLGVALGTLGVGIVFFRLTVWSAERDTKRSWLGKKA